MKNWIATSFWARRSAACEWIRAPVKRQMITTLAAPSIPESRPKPISAIEPAAIPATIAIPPSRPIQIRLSQDSALARRAACSQSAAGGSWPASPGRATSSLTSSWCQRAARG